MDYFGVPLPPARIFPGFFKFPHFGDYREMRYLPGPHQGSRHYPGERIKSYQSYLLLAGSVPCMEKWTAKSKASMSDATDHNNLPKPFIGINTWEGKSDSLSEGHPLKYKFRWVYQVIKWICSPKHLNIWTLKASCLHHSSILKRHMLIWWFLFQLMPNAPLITSTCVTYYKKRKKNSNK